MPTEVILPRVDMDMATGKVSRWFVEENAKVEKGQVIFEIETDKAAMEIESPASGIIRDRVGEEGKEVPVGSVVATIYAEGEAYEAPAPRQDANMPSAAVQAAPGAPLDIPTAADAPAEPAAPAPTTPPVISLASTAAATQAAEEVAGIRATPLARRLAREHRIELSGLSGTGPRGRIQHSDVLAHMASQAARTKPVMEARPASSQASFPAQAVPARHAGGTLNRVWLRQGSGTPLVLIHGFAADLNGWRPLLPSLPADRPVLAIDLPGHGRSPLSGQKTLDDMAASVSEAILEEGVASAHLIGHSLGGAVAAAVAAQSQIDIRSLFLISPAGLGPHMNGDFIAGFLRANTEASLAPWIRELTFDEKALGPSFVAATLRGRTDALVKSQGDVAANLFPDGTQSFSIRHLLENFDWPVKVMFGLEDRIIPARHAAGLPGTVAVHLFPATGHMPQIEQRQAIGRLAAELACTG